MESDDVCLDIEDLWVELGGVPVLKGINVEVKRGEAAALIGRNGAGKTTTLRAIVGSLSPSKGRINIFSENPAELSLCEVAELGVGYIDQEKTIFPGLTVEENLQISYGESVPPDVLESVYSTFSELEEIRERKGIHLSGGERVMVALARVLIKDPALLLLDEPFEGLAPKPASSLTSSIRELKEKGIGMLITESGMVEKLRGLSSKAYGLDRGELVFEGQLEEMFEDPTARKRIWGI